MGASPRDTPGGIGGFVALDGNGCGGDPLRPEGLRFANGRACLDALLDALKPARAHVPFHTCPVVFELLERRGVEIVPLAASAPFSPRYPEGSALAADAVLIANDYFGLQGATMRRLAALHGPRLIVDASQAFYARAPDGSHGFNSARKFFGVPDGAYLSTPLPLAELPPRHVKQEDVAHLVLRADGQQAAAYESYQAAEARQPSRALGMSRFSVSVLESLPLRSLAQRRRENFARLDALLRERNTLPREMIDAIDQESTVPLAYPFLPAVEIDRAALAAEQVFVPLYWPGLRQWSERWEGRFEAELGWLSRFLPLPVSQCYGRAEMERVASLLARLG